MELKNEKRFLAILALQNKQKKHSPGSYLYEVYDKAIDLALNPERQVNNFLTHNLFRDAKRILNRKKEKVPAFIALSTENEDGIANFIEDLVVDFYTPFDQLLLLNYQEMVYAQCALLHPHAINVLNGISNGMLNKEIAISLRISESLTKKIRVILKATIYKIILN